MNSFGIYVHVPWCRRRCVYCNFYFEVGRAKSGFLARARREIEHRLSEMRTQQAKTLYFGGGTPSTVAAKEFRRFIAFLKESAMLEPGAEITLEANPEDITYSFLSELRKAGVNRLSLGVQSLKNGTLKWLSRMHNGLQAKERLDLALSLFGRVSVDLIIGVPGQEIDEIREDMDWLHQKGVGQISTYLLTVEENTPLHKMVKNGRYRSPNEDFQAEHYEIFQEYLPTLGYHQYEVSSFAQSGEESQHNRLYWAQGAYLGVGPGAHSMRLIEDGSVVRRHTTSSLKEWWQAPMSGCFTEEKIPPPKAFLEAVAFGIRDVKAGIDLQGLAKRHRISLPKAIFRVIGSLTELEYLEKVDGKVFLTSRGARYADHVSRELLALD